jgi:subtilase family serine protease
MLERKGRRAVAAGVAVLLAAAIPGAASASTQQPAQQASTIQGQTTAIQGRSATTAAQTPATSQFKANSGETVTSLHTDVARGTLLQAHGTRKACPLCDALVVTTTRTASTPLSSAAPAGYGPADLTAAYDLPATSKSTATIAIIDAGVDGTLAADLAAYRKAYGLPACTAANGCLKLEDYTGGRQPAPQSSGPGADLEEQVALETSLDMDMASAACGTCHLLEISVPWQDGEDDNDVTTGDFAQAVGTAIAAHASAVSISYGYTADVTNTHGADLAALDRKGVAIVASTGDSGFNGGIHQSWPSDLPSVVAAGGVTLPATGAPTAWYAAGSGCETAFAAADGQPAKDAAACGRHRAAADVSADADPATGVAVYDTYAPSSGFPLDWLIIGGTSASAPYLAGLYARAGHLATVEGPDTLYRAAAGDFTDITSGSNEELHECASYPGVSASLCNAGKGWDGPTGLGQPHGLGAF